MSRKLLVPFNVFCRQADPLPPLFPTPNQGDMYFNTKRNVLRVFTVLDPENAPTEGKWTDYSGGGSDAEVIIGPTQPTDPDNELWVDTASNPPPGGGGGGGGGYLGDWDAATPYPSGAIVTHEDGTWGGEYGAASGEEPNDNTSDEILVGTDMFQDAAPIIVDQDGMVVVSDGFDAGGLTLEPGEPTPLAGITGTVWWSYQPIATGSVTFDTEMSDNWVDTVLTVYSAPALTTQFSDLTRISYDDDGGYRYTSRLSVGVEAFKTYYIQVGTYGSDVGGTYVLRLTNAMRTWSSTAPPNPWTRLSVSKPALVAFVDGRIQDHRDASDPHPVYLLSDDAENLYSTKLHSHGTQAPYNWSPLTASSNGYYLFGTNTGKLDAGVSYVWIDHLDYNYILQSPMLKALRAGDSLFITLADRPTLDTQPWMRYEVTGPPVVGAEGSLYPNYKVPVTVLAGSAQSPGTPSSGLEYYIQVFYRQGPNMIVLGPADPVPAGTPPGTVIVRKVS